MPVKTTLNLTAVGSADYIFDESDEQDLVNDIRSVLEDYFTSVNVSIEELDTETID